MSSHAGLKSRHYRDESDPLLGLYSSHIAATTSIHSNPLHCTVPLGDGAFPFDGAHRENGLIASSNSEDTDDPQGANKNNNDSLRSSHGAKRMGYRVHRVSYTPQNHLQVLFRMHSSAFPQVFPFCVANILWAIVVMSLKEHQILDLTFHSSIGHSFMGLLVSFLVVSRSKISYDRFMDLRRKLATTYHVCRELTQFANVYTFSTTTKRAKEWRHEVCFRTIVLLRVTMDTLLWSSTERHQWEDEYFRYKKSDGDPENVSKHFFRFCHLTHGRRSMIDENFRAPISLAHSLRHMIMLHPTYLGYTMPVNEYRDLLLFVTKFTEAFHEFRVMTFTPYPFALLQMTRTFLLFWVYSLPLVLLKEYRFASTVLIITFVTLGFIGVEYVSMALDDPFGDDTNDVDEHGMALLVYEDIYMSLYRTDGYAAAKGLREAVVSEYKHGRGLDCYRDDMKGYDFWELQRWGEESAA